MNKNRSIKFKIVIVLFVILIMIIALLFYWFSMDKNEKKSSNIDYSVPEALIYFNESTESYEIILGYLLDPQGKPIENANISIEINGTTFYTYPDSKGKIKIIVPEKLVSVNDLNSQKSYIIKEEDKPDWYLLIKLKYP